MMASLCVAAPGENDDELTVEEANTIVVRYQSVQFGNTPAFDDVLIDPQDGNFHYIIDGTSYSVPVDYVRHTTN